MLNIAFRVADEQGLPLLDLADLRALLVWVGQNADALSLAIRQRRHRPPSARSSARCWCSKTRAANTFFGEPALELADLMAHRPPTGAVGSSILAADKLMGSPRLYATFLLWLLSELFEELPEVGDPDKPKLVFFFDEAHLLFDDAPKALVNKVEQVARLIRSKGVGVYFVTQNPADVPEDVLGQLGNRVQHALRAFTARDRKALKQAAETYRDNPRFSIEDAIREVGTGEAVTSMLEAKGAPGIAERTLIRPPSSQLGPIGAEARDQLRATSHVAGKYEDRVDRDSAREMLMRRAEEAAKAAEEAEAREAAAEGGNAAAGGPGEFQLNDFSRARRYNPGVDDSPPGTTKPATRSRKAGSDGFGGQLGEAMTKAVISELKGTTGKRIVRGILGGLFKGR